MALANTTVTVQPHLPIQCVTKDKCMFIFKNSEEATKWLVDEGLVPKTTMPANVYKDLAFAAYSGTESHNRLWFYTTTDAYKESVKILEAAKKVNGRPIGAFVGPNSAVANQPNKTVFASVREAARFFNEAESTLRGRMQKALPLNGIIFCNYALKTPAIRSGMPKLATVKAIPAQQPIVPPQPTQAFVPASKTPIIPNPLVLTPENLSTPVMLVRAHARYLFKNLAVAADWYNINYRGNGPAGRSGVPSLTDKDIYLMIRRLKKSPDVEFERDVWKYHNSDFFRQIVQVSEKAKAQRTTPVYVNTPSGKATCFASEVDAEKATGVDIKSIYTSMMYQVPAPGGYAFSRFEVHNGNAAVPLTPTATVAPAQRAPLVITSPPDFSNLIPL